jgi:cell division septum initiation protein DivIVA
MGNNTKPQIIIDDVEYDYDTFTDQQKLITDHITDLERKVNSAKFNLDQLQIGRDAFLNMLKQSLLESKAAEPVTDVIPKPAEASAPTA